MPPLSEPRPPTIRGADFPAAAFHEEVVANNFLGHRMMVISRPRAVHHILVANADNYVRPDAAFRVLEPPIGGGLFLAEGEEWWRQRRLLAPTFSPRAIAGLGKDYLRHATHMLTALHAGPKDQVDLFAIVQDLTMAIAADTMFGIDLTPHANAVRTMASGYTKRLAQADMFDFLLPRWLRSPRDWPRLRFRRRWLELIGRIVDERRRTGELGGLFAQLDASEGPRGLLVPQVATLLVTGSETTGAALYWSIYLAATAPEMQERVAEEARAADIEADPTTALERLVYTRALVNEAMRLYPPALSIVRRAITPDIADGVEIVKDAIIQTAPWVLHRHRLFWDRPNAFDPDRFLPEAPPPERYTFIPFGIGPRQCIGMQFALAEATLVLALLLRDFRIAPTTDRPVTLVARITLQPLDPAPFRLAPRTGGTRAVRQAA